MDFSRHGKRPRSADAWLPAVTTMAEPTRLAPEYPREPAHYAPEAPPRYTADPSATRLAADYAREPLDFPGVDMGAGAAPAAATPGQTSRYDVADLIDPSDGRRRAAPRRRNNVEEPKGGDVAVGTMNDFLMDPSENPHEDGESKPAPTFSGSLELGESAFGEGKYKEETPAPAATGDEEDGASTVERMERMLPPKKPTLAEERDFLRETVLRNKRRNQLLFSVLPQAVLLVAVIVVGYMTLGGVRLKSGIYEAVFSDSGNRKVTCETNITENDLAAGTLGGSFRCRLYPTEFSTRRIDEPQALKTIMGDGNLAFIGEAKNGRLILTLGPFPPEDTRNVHLEAKIADGGKKVVGYFTGPLGHRGSMEMRLVASL